MEFERTLPLPTRDLAQARADLDRYGLALLPDALDAEELRALRERLAEQAAGERASALASFDYGNNQRVYNLISKGAAFRALVVKPWLLDLMKHLLGSPVTLSNLFGNIAGPGNTPQGLHSDQIYAPPETPYAIVANAIWMLDDFRDDNGATRVVPGSHRWRVRPDRQQLESFAIPAVGRAGTALVYDGRIWHGAGENRGASELRHGIISYFSRPFIRAQENWTLSMHPDALADASPELLDLLGYRVWMTLGSVQGPWGTPPRGAPPESVTVSRSDPFVGELDAHGVPRGERAR